MPQRLVVRSGRSALRGSFPFELMGGVSFRKMVGRALRPTSAFAPFDRLTASKLKATAGQARMDANKCFYHGLHE